MIEEGEVGDGRRGLAGEEPGVHPAEHGGAGELLARPEQPQDRVRQLELPERPLPDRHRLEVPPQGAGEVLAEAQRGLGGVQILDEEGGVRRQQTRFDRVGDELLVGAEGERVGHRATMAEPGGIAPTPSPSGSP